jgi:hypothetical protein
MKSDCNFCYVLKHFAENLLQSEELVHKDRTP